MDVPTFWELTLSGIIVSWPGIAVSVWLAVRHVKKHVDQRTASQTGDIRQMTDAQTASIETLTEVQTRKLLKRSWWRRA
jgi:hypothetical protein